MILILGFGGSSTCGAELGVPQSGKAVSAQQPPHEFSTRPRDGQMVPGWVWGLELGCTGSQGGWDVERHGGGGQPSAATVRAQGSGQTVAAGPDLPCDGG